MAKIIALDLDPAAEKYCQQFHLRIKMLISKIIQCIEKKPLVLYSDREALIFNQICTNCQPTKNVFISIQQIVSFYVFVLGQILHLFKPEQENTCNSHATTTI